MPAHDLALLIDAARMAGRVATSFAGDTAQRWDKADNAGPVTAADLAVNDMLSATLRLARPDYGWLSEETEDSAARLSSDAVFILDPIDGTRSFIEGSRTWAHSLAIAHHGEITAAVVYLPLRDMLYTAAVGRGAHLNGEPLEIKNDIPLIGAQILSTKANMADSLWPNGVPEFERHHRPSLAYRLGLVGQAKFDGMLTLRPSWEWDIAAGALIVTEAGGTISDKTGAPLRFNNLEPLLNGVVAGGTQMHADTIAALNHSAN